MLYQKIVYSTYIASQFLTPRTVDASAYTVASVVQSAATTMMVMSAVQSPDKTVVDAGALLAACTGSYGDTGTACQQFTISTNSQDMSDITYCDVADIHYQNEKFDEDTCWCSNTDFCSDNPYAEVWFAGDWYDITQVGVQACHWKEPEYVTQYKVGYHDGSAWTFVGGSTLNSATLYDVSGEISCGKDSCTNPPAKSIGSVSCKGIRLYPREAYVSCSTNMEIYGTQVPPPTKSPTQKPTTKSPTKVPTTKNPTKNPTKVPTTGRPTTDAPTTDTPTTSASTTSASTTSASTTDAPTSDAPTTDAPTSQPTSPPTENNEGQVDEDDQGEDDDGQLNEEESAADGGGVAIAGISNVELLILATSTVVVCLLCVVGMCVVIRMDRRKKANLQEVLGQEVENVNPGQYI